MCLHACLDTDVAMQNGNVAFGAGNTSSAFNAAGSNAMNGHTAGTLDLEHHATGHT